MKKSQLNKEQIESMLNIVNAMELTTQEKVLLFYYRTFARAKARKLAFDVYYVMLGSQSKKFKKRCYIEYAWGKVFNDFSGFHTLMITKCDEFDLDWTKFISKDGKAV